MYIHEINVKLYAMKEYELKYINKDFQLWNELHDQENMHEP